MTIARLFISFFQLLVFSLTNTAESTSKSPFAKFEFASFDVNSLRTKYKDSAEINVYSKIDSKGKIQVLQKDEENGKLTSASYQLTANQLEVIHLIIGKTSLQEYIVIKSLKEGEHYAGSYNFLRVTYQNGKTDNICFIDDYMSDDFQSDFKPLENLFYRHASQQVNSDSGILTHEFRQQLQTNYNKQGSYLPPIEFPPPSM